MCVCVIIKDKLNYQFTIEKVMKVDEVFDDFELRTDAINNIEYSLDQTWYYNHATQEFKPGPTLLEKRNNHAAATIIDKITKANVPVVSGGVTKAGNSGNSHVILDSTELLIHGEWQAGELLTTKNYCWFCSFETPLWPI